MMNVNFDCSLGRNQLSNSGCQSLELHPRRQQQRLIPTSKRNSNRRGTNGSQRVQAFQMFQRANARYLQMRYYFAHLSPKSRIAFANYFIFQCLSLQ
jgi:hypothetical protein